MGKKFLTALIVAMLALVACGEAPTALEKECEPTLYEPKYGNAIPEMCVSE